jgi:hypothetical protein
LIHKRTSRGGRRGRGRMYIPWASPTSDIGETGVVTSTRVTAAQSAINAWRTAVIAAAGPIVLLHRPSTPGTTHPSTPGPPDEVSSLVVDPLVATQRRRLGR